MLCPDARVGTVAEQLPPHITVKPVQEAAVVVVVVVVVEVDVVPDVVAGVSRRIKPN